MSKNRSHSSYAKVNSKTVKFDNIELTKEENDCLMRPYKLFRQISLQEKPDKKLIYELLNC